ncbi:MAG: aldo/keto reductase [Anaerolineaceae bacterium]|nr:aldo/keto reductase [Anaerolineaceae bacterium]
MIYRKLGKTEIEVSTIALGCWAFEGGSVWGYQDDSDSIATVHAALDVGVNFFDTAEAYGEGHSEEVLGKALKGRRDEVVIATKVSPNHLAPEDIVSACERSLERLQTDYIDLYQIHWPNHELPLVKSWREMEKLVEDGKVRAIGVSNFGVQDTDDMLKFATPASNQLPYSLLWRGIEFELQKMCVENQISILCYSPLGQGLLTGKYASIDEIPQGRARSRLFSGEHPEARHEEEGAELELFMTLEMIKGIAQEAECSMADISLAWLLSKPGVSSVLAGGRKPDHILQNVKASEFQLETHVVQALDDVSAMLKELMGTNLDMFQSISRFR